MVGELVPENGVGCWMDLSTANGGLSPPDRPWLCLDKVRRVWSVSSSVLSRARTTFPHWRTGQHHNLVSRGTSGAFWGKHAAVFGFRMYSPGAHARVLACKAAALGGSFCSQPVGAVRACVPGARTGFSGPLLTGGPSPSLSFRS